ncbi:hypothetical protein [Ferrovibrio terrae]|uniref:hypothetical protein n=1 Tax=Ferrovibrio terrae TaxID=2594003 RepID=UPI003137E60D
MLSPSLQVTLSLSDERFAQIMRHRKGDESLAELILRLLDEATKSTTAAFQEPAQCEGVRTRFHHFSEGFEIFRVANGVRYSAKACGGKWLTPSGNQYASLNELSRSVTSTPENAWMSWNYVDANGKTRRINEIRDKKTIAKRNRPTKAAAEDGESNTWRADVFAALKGLGEPATLYEIYTHTKFIRGKRGASLPENAEAIIRRTLEENSSDSKSYKGRFNLFKSANGIGSGIWALR